MRPQLKALGQYPTGTALFLGLILYSLSDSSTYADDNSSTEIVAEWDFVAKEDLRKDGWPDGWTRRTGPDYPKFIPIAIHQDARSAEELKEIENVRRLSSQFYVAWQQNKWPWQVIPEKVPPAIDQLLERSLLNPYLRIQMDGSAAEVLSPPIPVDIHSSYFMSASIHCDSTDYDASAKLRFLDTGRKTLFEMPTKAFAGKTGWKSASSQSQYPFRDDIAFVQVILQVLPKSMKAYRGEFGFDAIRVFRTPRISLFVDNPLPYYRIGEEVVVRCTASGMTTDQSSIKLVLIDHTGHEVSSENMLFVRKDAQQPRFVTIRSPDSKSAKTSYWDGSCEWRLPNLAPGYYEITTQLSKGKSGVFELEEQFVVLPDEIQRKPDSRFGWTMSTKNNEELESIDTSRLVEVLRRGQVGRVKLPIWFDSRDAEASKAAIDRVEKVQLTGIRCVGVIATPPLSLHSKFARLNPEESGTALEDTLIVQTFLEPVMRQMCPRISEFQIGWDHETNFISNPRISQSLDAIKKLVNRYGQETQIIASRSPLLAAPKVAAIDRWQLYCSHPLTAVETENVFEKEGKSVLGSRPPWMNVTPIDASDYSLSVRVQDLVHRMVKIAGDPTSQGTTAWVSNPTDPEVGLLDRDGGPREMFLPFRSTAAALAGMRQVGSIPIQSLGVNYIIASGDHAKLIAWSARSTTVQLYLGEDVSARDIWGRSVPIETKKTPYGPEQRLTIDRWPVIIDGIDLRVAKWRMGIALDQNRIDPLVGQTQELNVRFANTIPDVVNGYLTIIAPSILADESRISLEIDGNTSSVISTPVRIRPDANTSSAPIKIAISIRGDRPVNFVVDQEIQVGTNDFEFEIRYEIDSENRLLLRIEAINYQTDPLSFDCMLLIPNRPRERTQIAGLLDRVTKMIVLNDAKSLIGKTLWLRCEQISTNRVLNYRIEINP